MKKLFSVLVFVFVSLLACSLTANAQERARISQTKHDSRIVTIANGAGKAAIIVVRSAARVTYKTTIFLAKEVAKPVLFHVVAPAVRRVTPSAGRFALRNAVRYVLPLALRLSLF